MVVHLQEMLKKNNKKNFHLTYCWWYKNDKEVNTTEK